MIPPVPSPPAPSRRQQIEDLFNQVADLTDPGREAILAAIPDPELIHEVRSLLAELGTDIGQAIDRAAALVDADPQIPTRIGEFRIIGVLGEGGMGRVYEAEQETPRRLVALKVIRAGVLSRSVLRRFNHEAHVLGQLKHPGIAQVFQAGIARAEGVSVGADPADGAPHLPYFAMELVRGPTLTAFARKHQLPLRVRLELLAQVCDAVHHAHQRGVIHRDLKPANILVDGGDAPGPIAPSGPDPGWSPKILDFGIARLAETDARSTLDTQAGQIVGTLGYMSPEQVEGDHASLDIRSDIYSLGVIGYELLAGKLPLDISGKSVAAVVTLIRQSEPPRLGMLDPALRGDIETIIAKAIDKDRDRRYSSAAELAADIRRHLRDEPITARPAGTLYHFRKFARRNRPLVFASILVLLGITAAAVTSTLFALRESTARAHADAALRRANLSAALADVSAGNASSARQRLAAVAPADRAWEWNYLDHLCHRFADSLALAESCAVVPIPGTLSSPTTNLNPPDVLILPHAGGILSRRSAHSPPQPLYEITGPIRSLACSPDARTILTLAGDKLTLRELAAGAPRWTRPGVLPLGKAPFSADGARIVVAASTNQVLVLDAASGEPLHQFTIPTIGELQPRFDRVRLTPDAPVRECITAVTPIGTDLFDPDTGVRLRSLPLLLARVLTDGHTFVGDRQSDMAALDLFTGVQRSIGPLGSYRVSAVEPSGSWLVTQDYSSSFVVTDPSTASVRYRLHGEGRGIAALTVTPDGRWLLSANERELHWWDMHAGPSPRAVPAANDAGLAACINHDGSRVAVLGWGSVRAWDTRAGRNIWTSIPARTPWQVTAAFSPDDKGIAIAGWEGLITVLDAESGSTRWAVLTRQGDPLPTSVLWTTAAGSPTLLIGDSAGTLRTFDASSGRDIAPPILIGGRIIALAAAPTAPGRILALTEDGRLRELSPTAPDQSRTLCTLDPSDSKTGLLVPCPTSTLVLISSGTTDTRLIDARTGSVVARWASLGAGAVAADFSADGSRLEQLLPTRSACTAHSRVAPRGRVV